MVAVGVIGGDRAVGKNLQQSVRRDIKPLIASVQVISKLYGSSGADGKAIL